MARSSRSRPSGPSSFIKHLCHICCCGCLRTKPRKPKPSSPSPDPSSPAANPSSTSANPLSSPANPASSLVNPVYRHANLSSAVLNPDPSPPKAGSASHNPASDRGNEEPRIKPKHHRTNRTLDGSLYYSEASVSSFVSTKPPPLPVAVPQRPCLRRRPIPPFPEPAPADAAPPAPPPAKVAFAPEARVKVIRPCGQLLEHGHHESTAGAARPDVLRRELSAASAADGSHSCHYEYDPAGHTLTQLGSSRRVEREAWKEMGWREYAVGGTKVWMGPAALDWLCDRSAACDVGHPDDLPPAVRVVVLARLKAWERDVEDAGGWQQVRFGRRRTVWVEPGMHAALHELLGDDWTTGLEAMGPEATKILWDELEVAERLWMEERERTA